MANPEFASVLEQSFDNIERPQPLPPGHYLCVIRDNAIRDKSSQKETPYVEYLLIPTQAQPDVDEKWLAKVLTKADGTQKKLSDMTIRARFWTTDDAIWRLKKFLLDDLQVEYNGESIDQTIDTAIGHQVVAYLKHTTSKNTGDVYAEVRSTSPVSAPAKRMVGKR